MVAFYTCDIKQNFTRGANIFNKGDIHKCHYYDVWTGQAG